MIPGGSGWVLAEATAINDAGQIAGYGTVHGKPVALTNATGVYHHAVRSIVPFMRAAEARITSPQSFVQSFRAFTGNENWFYLDSVHIGWIQSGWFPKHAPGTDIQFPIWGTGRYDWQHFTPGSYGYARLDPSHNPIMVPLTITTVCTGVADPNNPGKKILKLPACTTWKVPGGNTACSADADGSDPTTAIASSTSKCKCQPGFTIPIFVETPTITTTKSPNPATLDANTTGPVTFSVTVKNNGSITVHLSNLTDDTYGNVADPTNHAIVSTTCLQAAGEPPHDIAPGATYACSFVASVSVGAVGDEQTDIVCASGTDTQGGTVGGTQQTDPPSSYCADATVTASEIPSATLDKIVKTADVTYQVTVANTSAAHVLTLTKLCDDQFGDISTGGTSSGGCPAKSGTGVLVSGTTTCPQLPADIAAGSNIKCTFVGRIIESNTDTVKGTLNDAGALHTITPSDSATVTISN